MMRPSEYQDIGQYLRESRESLRVPVEQAARALHIRAKYLQALESGRLEDLPGKAYIRGYIRTYADYLQLNTQEVLEAYSSLMGAKGPEFFIPEPTSRQNLPSRHVILFTILGIGLLYAYWYFYLHDTTRLSRMVADLPAAFAHLLDKPAPAAMDKAWEDCLGRADAECFNALRAKASIPPKAGWYDIDIQDGASQEP